MHRQHANELFTTTRIDDNVGGSATIRLWRESHGQKIPVADITFWDAVGQFFVKLFVDELPLSILEELTAEAKEQIKVR